MTSTPPDPADSDASDDSVRVIREDVVVRRSPRYWRIMALGAGLGAIVAFVLTFALPEIPQYSQGQVFGFTLVLFVVLFGAIAAMIALLLDRVVGRKTRVVQAERFTSLRPTVEEGPDHEAAVEPTLEPATDPATPLESGPAGAPVTESNPGRAAIAEPEPEPDPSTGEPRTDPTTRGE